MGIKNIGPPNPLPSIHASPDDLREYWRYEFAGRAMIGRLAKSAYPCTPDEIASFVVMDADALLAALEAPRDDAQE